MSDCPYCDTDLGMLCSQHAPLCGDCGSPLETVRPGKVQCWCEHPYVDGLRDEAARLRAERDELRRRLDVQSTELVGLREAVEDHRSSRANAGDVDAADRLLWSRVADR